MTPKELITEKEIEAALQTEFDKEKLGNTSEVQFCYGAFKRTVRSLLSTHTREVAEKAFEAGRTISLKDYNPDLKIGEHPLKYKSFEDYLNSPNPK